MKRNFLKNLLLAFTLFLGVVHQSSALEYDFRTLDMIIAEFNITDEHIFHTVEEYDEYAHDNGLLDAQALHDIASDAGFFDTPFYIPGSSAFLVGDDSAFGDYDYHFASISPIFSGPNNSINSQFLTPGTHEIQTPTGDKLIISTEEQVNTSNTYSFSLPDVDVGSNPVSFEVDIPAPDGYIKGFEARVHHHITRDEDGNILNEYDWEPIYEGNTLKDIQISNLVGTHGLSETDVIINNTQNTTNNLNVVISLPEGNQENTNNLSPITIDPDNSFNDIKTTEFPEGLIVENVDELINHETNERAKIDYTYARDEEGNLKLESVDIKQRYIRVPFSLKNLGNQQRAGLGESAAYPTANLAGLADGSQSNPIEGFTEDDYHKLNANNGRRLNDSRETPECVENNGDCSESNDDLKDILSWLRSHGTDDIPGKKEIEKVIAEAIGKLGGRSNQIIEETINEAANSNVLSEGSHAEILNNAVEILTASEEEDFNTDYEDDEEDIKKITKSTLSNLLLTELSKAQSQGIKLSDHVKIGTPLISEALSEAQSESTSKSQIQGVSTTGLKTITDELSDVIANAVGEEGLRGSSKAMEAIKETTEITSKLGTDSEAAAKAIDLGVITDLNDKGELRVTNDKLVVEGDDDAKKYLRGLTRDLPSTLVDALSQITIKGFKTNINRDGQLVLVNSVGSTMGKGDGGVLYAAKSLSKTISDDTNTKIDVSLSDSAKNKLQEEVTKGNILPETLDRYASDLADESERLRKKYLGRSGYGNAHKIGYTGVRDLTESRRRSKQKLLEKLESVSLDSVDDVADQHWADFEAEEARKRTCDVFYGSCGDYIANLNAIQAGTISPPNIYHGTIERYKYHEDRFEDNFKRVGGTDNKRIAELYAQARDSKALGLQDHYKVSKIAKEILDDLKSSVYDVDRADESTKNEVFAKADEVESIIDDAIQCENEGNCSVITDNLDNLLNNPPPIMATEQHLEDYEKKFAINFGKIGGKKNKIVSQNFQEVSENNFLGRREHVIIANNAKEILELTRTVGYSLDESDPDDLKIVTRKTLETRIYNAHGDLISRYSKDDSVTEHVKRLSDLIEIKEQSLADKLFNLWLVNDPISATAYLRIKQYYNSEKGRLQKENPDWSETRVVAEAWVSLGQTGLDIVGMIPAVGEIADAVNGAIYLVRGDVANATISAIALIPVGGQAATGTRLAVKVVDGIAVPVAKNADEVADLVKAAKQIIPTSALDDIADAGAQGVLKQMDDLVKNGQVFPEMVEGMSSTIKDLAEKTGNKLSWPEIKALFKRGNDFNRKARNVYEFNEVTLKGIGGKAGKRLDSYIPGKEIISRKATDLGNIKTDTFKGYLNELITKYPKGAKINAPKFGDTFKNKVLSGDYFLEIPLSNKTIFENSSTFKKVLSDFNKNNDVLIKIKYLAE